MLTVHDYATVSPRFNKSHRKHTSLAVPCGIRSLKSKSTISMCSWRMSTSKRPRPSCVPRAATSKSANGNSILGSPIRR